MTNETRAQSVFTHQLLLTSDAAMTSGDWTQAFETRRRRRARKRLAALRTGGNAGQANYSSAKAAQLGLTKSLAKEWGRHKVNVNAVAFGVITTRLTEATDDKKTITVEGREIGVGIPTKVAAGFAAAIPMGRPGTPAEAAGSIYLLCTPESDYLSGQVVCVSGGLSI